MDFYQNPPTPTTVDVESLSSFFDGPAPFDFSGSLIASHNGVATYQGTPPNYNNANMQAYFHSSSPSTAALVAPQYHLPPSTTLSHHPSILLPPQPAASLSPLSLPPTPQQPQQGLIDTLSLPAPPQQDLVPYSSSSSSKTSIAASNDAKRKRRRRDESILYYFHTSLFSFQMIFHYLLLALSP